MGATGSTNRRVAKNMTADNANANQEKQVAASASAKTPSD